MTSALAHRCLLAATLCMSPGCASLISEGQVGQHEVHLDGTGFAWVDETTYELSASGAQLKDRDSDDVMLHLVFTSAVFDPTVDRRSLPSAERQRIADELARGDLLRLYVRRGDRLVPGDVLHYASDENAIPDATPYLWYTQLVLGAPDLPPDASYPDEVEVPARDLRVDLALNEVEPRLLGEVTVKIRRGEEDPGVEGDINVRFDVERVPERVAECNFAPEGAGGVVNPCAELSLSE